MADGLGCRERDLVATVADADAVAVGAIVTGDEMQLLTKLGAVGRERVREGERQQLAREPVTRDPLRVTEAEVASYAHTAAIRADLAIPPLELPYPEGAECASDTEFEAVMRMKMEPLVVTDADADAFEELKRRRAKRVAKPLPIE
jgi:hypothetical protein